MKQRLLLSLLMLFVSVGNHETTITFKPIDAICVGRVGEGGC